jgi:hypothetical protein
MVWPALGSGRALTIHNPQGPITACIGLEDLRAGKYRFPPSDHFNSATTSPKVAMIAC